MRNVDIDLLRSFLAIYDSGSFSHAAERMGRTQSTISQQMKKLEDILGHEARFRNARLAYYNGDFQWAQAQFDVLKAYAPGLSDIVPYGSGIFGTVNRWLVRPLYMLLSSFIGQVGLVILLLTVVVDLTSSEWLDTFPQFLGDFVLLVQHVRKWL